MWTIDDAHGVWVGANRYDDQGWVTYEQQEALSQTEVTAVAIDGQGRFWFGTRDRGLVVLDGDTWSSYDQEDSSLSDNWVKDILIDHEDRVWVATPAGLNVITGQWWQLFTTQAGLINDNVLTLALDNEDRVWLGTKAGVSRFDGENWENYAVLDVEDIAVDDDGNVWIGTLFDGLLIHVSESE
jgi:ligand-binding sensor domain-containing protein